MTLQRFLADLDPLWWESGDWANRLALVPITNTGTNTYSLTEPTDGGGGIRRGRITHTAGAEGSDRRAYVTADYARDSRVLFVVQNKSLLASGANCQMGGILRCRLDDPDGFARGWVLRHDWLFGQDALWSVGNWRWTPGGGGATFDVEGAGNTLTGIQRIVTATGASRTANVVTAAGLSPANGEPNGLVAGHQVTVDFADNGYDGTFTVTAAAAGATTATWAQTAADDPSAGAGTINDLDGVFPLAVEAVLIGQDCAVRVWRLGPDQVVPSWTDPAHAFIAHGTGLGDPYPARPGRSGLYVGHLDGSGIAEWGAFEHRRIR